MKQLLILVLFGYLLSCNSALGENVKAELDKAYGKAVAGDVRPILSFLDSIEDVNKSQFAELHGKYKQRFITADERMEFDDPFITNLYAHYTAYWSSSLLDPENERVSRKILVSKLNELSKKEGRKAGLLEAFRGPSIDKLETFLIATARRKGYFVLMGRTFPLRELMIWKKEESEKYQVELPSESFPVNVVFTQEFLSHGWLGYATFNRSHTGGWNVGDTIYRVGTKPGEDNEGFRVSILGHEGRHILDKKLYGELNGWILEYRAKLTELLLAEESFWNRLKGFKNEAQDTPSIPHTYASYRLLYDLIQELSEEQEQMPFHSFRFESYSIEELKHAIELILERSTKSLESNGP